MSVTNKPRILYILKLLYENTDEQNINIKSHIQDNTGNSYDNYGLVITKKNNNQFFIKGISGFKYFNTIEQCLDSLPVYAKNIEKWQYYEYERNSKWEQRKYTRSFENTVVIHKLFEKTYKNIYANSTLENIFWSDKIEINESFKSYLIDTSKLQNLNLWKNHWIYTEIEIYLKHPHFADICKSVKYDIPTKYFF